MGHSIASISEMTGKTPSSINKSLQGAYAKLHMEHEAIEARDLELSRLDEITASFYELATGKKTHKDDDGLEYTPPPDEKAAEVIFKAMDRRAKLMGLDAPEQKTVESNVQIGWIEDDTPSIIEGEASQTLDLDNKNITTRQIVEGTIPLPNDD
jgi:hypothetical protein